MRIVLMGQHFYPEEVSGAIHATGLVEGLVQRGHKVTFATCFPSYPKGIVFPGYRYKLFGRNDYAGAKVTRIWSWTSPKKSTIPRLINYGSFSALALFSGLAAGRPNLIMSYSPPLPLGISAWMLSRLWRVPWILRVEDLFPEAAITTGVIRNKAIIRVLEGMERFLYKHATHISVISEGFRRKLLAKGVPESKLSVTPVWADPEEIRPMDRETEFRREHGLQGKFVVLYSGNVGLTSSLEDALAAAGLMREDPDVHFLIIGEGMKKEKLQEMARAEGLTNVSFLPFQPRTRFPEVLASADVALVTLGTDSSTTSLPCKTFSYFASARPVIAVTPLESELADLIRGADAGVVVPPGEPEKLAAAVRELRGQQQRCEEMGRQGRSRLEVEFSREVVVEQYARLFAEIAR